MKKTELKLEIERLKSINVECVKEIRTLLSDGKEFDKLMIKCKYDNLELFEKSFWQGCSNQGGLPNGFYDLLIYKPIQEL